MKRLMTLFVGAASIAAAVMLISGCPAASSANPPSTADAAKAFTAMTMAQTSAPSANSGSVTWTPSGGTQIGTASFTNPSPS